MDEKQLMKDFCLVSGLDEQQAEGWKPLVLGCWKELCRRLRPAVQPQEHRERLSLACAALAYYRLQRMQGEVYSGIKMGDISLTAGSGQQSEAMVLGAYPQQLRARPQRQKLAVVAIQKVLMQPLGMQSFYGEEDQPLGRQAQVWMKISFCCPSGEECWRLWERCAQRLLFSDKLGAEQIECGEAVWQKDWGGVVLPVKLCCKFLISGSTGEASQPMPEQVRVVRKGV